MIAIARVLPFVLTVLSLACRTSPAAPAPAAGANGEKVSGAKNGGGEKNGAEKIGVLAPLGAPALSLWPEEYSGGLLALEVAPHGTAVKEGDVVARLDARAIDEQLHHGELELHTSELNRQALLERNQLEAQAAQSALARAQAGLERGRRSLESWKTQELGFEQRQTDLSKRYQDANVEDQTDELNQLEKMYKGDELIDATEDIVLKRSKRGLAITETQNELARDRAKHHQELDLALQTEQREEDFRAQQEAFKRLQAQQAIDARARADAELRGTDALGEQRAKLERLRKDRALFELHAPCAGILLHGDARAYRPGKTPARYERGSSLAARTDLFLVAPPEPAAVTFDVLDGERARFASGAELTVHALAGDATVSAQTTLDEYPRTLSTSETTLEGSATLAAPLAGAHYGERVRLEASAAAPAKP